MVLILTNNRQIFTTNLETAIRIEFETLKAHQYFMKVKGEELATMQSSLGQKQTQIGDNGSGLTSRRSQLESAKNEDQFEGTILFSELSPVCEKRTIEYDTCKSLRADEEAAIAEPDAILDSDSAVYAFAKAGATSSGSTGPAFMQIQRHEVSPPRRLHVIT